MLYSAYPVSQQCAEPENRRPAKLTAAREGCYDQLTDAITPTLITVAQPMQTIGHKAVEPFLAVIQERDAPCTRLVLDTALRIRASSGPAPAFRWPEGAMP